MNAGEARKITESSQQYKHTSTKIESIVDKYVNEAAEAGLTKCFIPMNVLLLAANNRLSMIDEYLDNNGFSYGSKIINKDTDELCTGYEIKW